MADRIPHIVLNLGDGVERKYRFSLNSVIDLQQRTGLKLSEFAKMIPLLDKDVSLLRLVIWIGLKANDPALTEDKLGDLLGLDNMMDVGVRVVEYLEQSMGITDEDLKNAARAAEEQEKNQKSGAGAPPSEPLPESASSQESSTT